MEKRTGLDNCGDLGSTLTYSNGGSTKPSAFAELRERFAQLTPPDITFGDEVLDNGRAGNGAAQSHFAPANVALSNGDRVEAQDTEVLLEFGDDLLGDLDIVDEVDLWEELPQAAPRASPPTKRYGPFLYRSNCKWWLYNQCIPRLLNCSAQRGFISLHQLARTLDVIGEDRLFISDLVQALNDAGVRATRSVARSRSRARDGKLPVCEAEAIFAALLARPPRPSDVLRYLGLGHMPLSEGTITFIAQAFELHRLTKYDENRHLERLLAARSRGGYPDAARWLDPEAWNTLYEDNILLACRIASQHAGLGLDIEDLIQEGCIGVAQGLRHYEPERVYRLQQYIQTWIFQAIRRALADQGKLIRVPVHFHEQVLRPLVKFVDEYAATHGEPPSVPTCLVALGLSTEHVEVGLQHLNEPASLENLPESQLTPLLPPWVDNRDDVADKALETILSETIQDVLAALGERQRAILTRRYGLANTCPETLEEVGQELGLTRERVRQIEAKALTKLHHHSRTKRYKDWYPIFPSEEEGKRSRQHSDEGLSIQEEKHNRQPSDEGLSNLERLGIVRKGGEAQ